MTVFFNTGLTQQQFLTQYWQKKPLLIRQAWEKIDAVLNADELAGLACEQDIESRLIQEFGENGPWQVKHGPFTEADFTSLPETHWTLLVQDVDKHVPELNDIMAKFNFIPDWRRDDLMVSYAPEGGSVGPHTDGYDVFLLQAQGTRRWQISQEPLSEAEFIDGLDLKILNTFEADDEWELQPGDMLYLPPHFAHHGVALNDCITFSIGFRAPTQLELLDAFMHSLMEREAGQLRYRDPGLQVCDDDKYIDIAALRRFKQSLVNCIEQADDVLMDAVGRLLTETKPSLELLADELMSESEGFSLSELFAQGEQLQRNSYIRVAWSEDDDNIQLFAAGETFKADKASRVVISILTGSAPIQAEHWQQIQAAKAAGLLQDLITIGCWHWQTETF